MFTTVVGTIFIIYILFDFLFLFSERIETSRVVAGVIVIVLTQGSLERQCGGTTCVHRFCMEETAASMPKLIGKRH